MKNRLFRMFGTAALGLLCLTVSACVFSFEAERKTPPPGQPGETVETLRFGGQWRG